MAVAGIGSHALSADTASAFLLAYSDKAIAELTAPGVDQSEKEKRFRRLLVEGFDLPSIGVFILGQYARSVSEEQRKAYLEAFQDAMTQRFLPLFSKHPNERLHIVRERISEADPNSTIVNAQITQPSAPPIKVDWRIRKRNGQYKILDITIEGASMAVTLRSDYTAVLARNNGRIEALTERLRQKVSEGAFAPDRPIKNLLN